jgi:hypothetical protein
MKKLFLAILIVLFVSAFAYAESVSFFDRDAGDGAVAYSFDGADAKWCVKSVRLHLSSAAVAAENLVISIDSAAGARYDVTLATQAMAGVQDILWVPDQDGGECLDAGDSLIVTYANTNGRKYGLEVEWWQK